MLLKSSCWLQPSVLRLIPQAASDGAGMGGADAKGRSKVACSTRCKAVL
jgi:hypothetical protein